MFFGMSQSFGQVPAPWSIIVNLFLALQFPVAHSILLSKRSSAVLARLAPIAFGPTLATTTYAIIASVQLLMLFALWTPSGIIWWQADGAVFAILCCLYMLSWLLFLLCKRGEWQQGAQSVSSVFSQHALATQLMLQLLKLLRRNSTNKPVIHTGCSEADSPGTHGGQRALQFLHTNLLFSKSPDFNKIG
jgi:hypothetical protein